MKTNYKLTDGDERRAHFLLFAADYQRRSKYRQVSETVLVRIHVIYGLC